jgi:sugar lactone lactonase YvrE
MTLADGMTIDSEGMLWIAVAGSGEVRRYSPRGEVDTVVRVPVACPTSVAFGGEDLDDLYITTMTPHGEPGPDPRVPKPLWPPRPLEGALFRCHVGVPGRPPHLFAG